MRRLLSDLIREIRDDGLFDTAAGVAFWILLSLPALLLAGLSSVSLLGAGLTDDLEEAVLEFIERVFTSEADALRTSVDDIFDRAQPGVFSVSLAVAVFTVSRGFAGLIRGLDVVYDVDETRNFAHTRLLGIGLALGTLATVAGSTALWAWSGSVGAATPLRVAGALVVLVVWAATMFHIGPNLRTPWRYDLPGATLAAVGWLLVSAGFGWYVRLIGDGNSLLGAAGALLLALTWLWIVCVVFLVGGELNELLAQRAGVVGAPVTVVDRVRAHIPDLALPDITLPGTRRRGRPDDAVVTVGRSPDDARADDPARDPADDPSDDRSVNPSDDPSDDRSDNLSDDRARDPTDDPTDDPADDPARDPADDRSDAG